jgi:hypothetical protein
MSENSSESTPQEASQSFSFRYDGPSGVRTGPDGTALHLVGNALRPEVFASGRIKEPLRFREALAVLYAVVGSDYRYVPKDRTAYLAWLRQQQATPAKDLWQSQRAYFDWILRNDPDAALILDPVISVQPDGLFFEVFSKDESTYARLSIDFEAIELDAPPVCGTTNIDFSKAFFESTQKLRGYRSTRLQIGRTETGIATEDPADPSASSEHLEKQVRVPDSWIRAFLQVQSAAMLPHTRFELSPIDLYNTLRQLRLNADVKRQARGLRFELIPGEAPRVVLEPWETVISASGDIYRGNSSQIIRIWGRRRLLLVRRLLPFVQKIEVHTLGSGMPSFWVLRAGPYTLTIALSGWTSNNWAQIVSFDLLLPRDRNARPDLDRITDWLEKGPYKASLTEISQALSLSGPPLLAALQLGCQLGQLIFDLERGLYRLRKLTPEPLEWDRLEFRNDREKQAHDLLAAGAVEIEKELRIPDKGTEITGKVTVAADQRDYQVTLLLAPTGQVLKANCTSSFFRKNGMKLGPSAPLIALRLFYAQLEAKRREEERAGTLRGTTTIEARTCVRRHEKGEDVFQLTLDHKRLKLRWGERRERPRVQNLVFNTIAEARSNYFARLDALAAKGYLDATEGGGA